MAIQQITVVFDDVPLPNDGDASFDEAAFSTVAKFNPWADEANALAVYCNEQAEAARLGALGDLGPISSKAKQVPSVNSTGTAMTFENTLYVTSFGVGIGTSAPSAPLDVVGEGEGVLAEFRDGVGANFIVETSGSTTSVGNYAGSSSSLAFVVSSSEIMRIDYTGRVGINTDSPEDTMHIMSPSGGSGSAWRSEGILTVDSSSNSGINIGSGTTSTGNIIFARSTDNNAGEIEYDHSSDTMSFWTSSAERVRIGSDGVVDFLNNATIAGKQVVHAGLGRDDVGAYGAFLVPGTINVGQLVDGSIMQQYPIRGSGYVTPTGTWECRGATGDNYGLYVKVSN